MTIRQYISLFFKLFDTGIPWSVIASTVLFALLSSYAIVKKATNKDIRKVILPWIVAYLFLMLYTTVVGRFQAVSGSQVVSGVNVHLMPFWSIQAIRDGYIETVYEKIYNVLFFVPYGVLISLWFKVYGLRKILIKSIFFGFLTSVTIELLQLLTRTGTCETDDVICNMVGCALGAMIVVYLRKCVRLLLLI